MPLFDLLWALLWFVLPIAVIVGAIWWSVRIGKRGRKRGS